MNINLDSNDAESFVRNIEHGVESDLNEIENPNEVLFDNSIELVETKIDPQVFDHIKNLGITFDIINYGSNNVINLKVALENILKDLFPNETNIDMEKIYNLSDLEKSKLASKITSIQQIPKEKKDNKIIYYNEYSGEKEISGLTYIDIQKLLDKGESIGSETLPFGLVSEFGNMLKNIKQQLRLDVFTSFYKIGDKIDPMPNAYSIATGDLSSTTGIGGEYNLGRGEWLYSKEKNKQLNYINFGPLSGPMECFVGAEGIDINRAGLGGGKIDFIFEKEGKQFYIKGEYTSEGLKLKKDPNLNDIDLSGNKIIIPQKYNGWNISVETRSSRYGPNDYDEVNFDLYMTNGNLNRGFNDIASVGQSNKNINISKGLGEYTLLENEDNYIKSMFNGINRFEKNTKMSPIPIDVNIGADNTIFTNPSDFITENSGYKEAFQKRITEREVSDEIKKSSISGEKQKKDPLSIFNNLLDDFMKTVDVSAFAKNNQDKDQQQQAQELLIQNRFLSFLSTAVEDNKVFESIVLGKYDIRPSYVSGKRNINIETSMSYIKS